MARCALILKISLAMLAFAANSILCRLALQGGHIDPLSFSSLRLASGAFVLSPLPLLSRQDHIIAVASAERVLPHGVCGAVLCRLYPGTETGREYPE